MGLNKLGAGQVKNGNSSIELEYFPLLEVKDDKGAD